MGPKFTRTMSEPECLARQARRRQERLRRHMCGVDTGPCFGARTFRLRAPGAGRLSRPASAPHRRSSRSDPNSSMESPKIRSTDVQTDLTVDHLDQQAEQLNTLAGLVPQMQR